MQQVGNAHPLHLLTISLVSYGHARRECRCGAEKPELLQAEFTPGILPLPTACHDRAEDENHRLGGRKANHSGRSDEQSWLVKIAQNLLDRECNERPVVVSRHLFHCVFIIHGS